MGNCHYGRATEDRTIGIGQYEQAIVPFLVLFFGCTVQLVCDRRIHRGVFASPFVLLSPEEARW